MRIAVTPAGSRGDFQPLLSLARGLKNAGHRVQMLASPNYEQETRAFGLEFAPLGIDVEAYARQLHFAQSPARAMYELLKLARESVAELVARGAELAKGADAVVAGGAALASRSIAQVHRIPYIYVAYTPQILKSSSHAPIGLPVHDMPRFANRLLWRAFDFVGRVAFGGPLNRARRRLGLAPIRQWHEHVVPSERTVLAADPEIVRQVPDVPLSHPPTGSLHLGDERPLPGELEAFLGAGSPPVYIGFGSMPDAHATQTTKELVEAARAAGARLVLSRGWASLGLDAAFGPDVLSIGPVSHELLFPRVAAVVHHGGSGTTAAALRAGRPQIVVPHAFDQFQWGRWVHGAQLGPAPLPRKKLNRDRLALLLQETLRNEHYAVRAGELGAKARSRDAVANAVAAVEELSAGA